MTITRAFARRRRRRQHDCIACGQPIFSPDEIVSVQGDAFHAACVLYSRRRR